MNAHSTLYSYDWVSLCFDFASAIAWPVFAVVALLLLRRPLAALLTSIEEIELWGAKGRTRKGNERAAELKASTVGKKSNLTSVSATPGEEDVDDDDDEHEEDGVVNEPIGSASDASAASAVVDLEGNKRVTLPGALESPVTTKDTSPTGAVGTMSQVAAISTETEIDRTADLLSFYERIVRERLRRSTYNTSTTSARLGAEIVGNSYADLKQALRVVHYLHFGMGSRGKIRSTRRMYQDLGLPAALQNDMLKARSFATDVHERRDVVDGVGAEAYIKTVDALVGRLCSWARNQLKA